MIVRIDVAPSLYEWASERSGVDADELHRKFPKLPEWEAGDQSPTLKQLEGFARATKTPGCGKLASAEGWLAHFAQF